MWHTHKKRLIFDVRKIFFLELFYHAFMVVCHGKLFNLWIVKWYVRVFLCHFSSAFYGLTNKIALSLLKGDKSRVLYLGRSWKFRIDVKVWHMMSLETYFLRYPHPSWHYTKKITKIGTKKHFTTFCYHKQAISVNNKEFYEFKLLSVVLNLIKMSAIL